MSPRSFCVHTKLTKCLIVALQFKKAFEDAQKSNIEESLKLAPPKESEPVLVDETKEEKTVDKAEAEEEKEEVKEETKE